MDPILADDQRRDTAGGPAGRGRNEVVGGGRLVE